MYDIDRVVRWTGSVDETQYEIVVDGIKSLLSEEQEAPINLEIISTGGSANIAFAFYQLVHIYGAILHTLGLGSVDSAALLLFLAGERGHRSLAEYTTLHFHRPFFNEVNVHVAQLKGLSEDIWRKSLFYAEIIAINSTCLTKRKVLNMLREEYVMSAEEARKCGLADIVIPAPGKIGSVQKIKTKGDLRYIKRMK